MDQKELYGIAVGVIALATLNKVRSEAIEIVPIVQGLISGNAGGYLSALAGTIGLVARYAFAAEAWPATSAPTTTT